jgi:hypothetical protein
MGFVGLQSLSGLNSEAKKSIRSRFVNHFTNWFVSLDIRQEFGMMSIYSRYISNVANMYTTQLFLYSQNSCNLTSIYWLVT